MNTASSPSLKAQNTSRLVAFSVVIACLLAWLSLGVPTRWHDWASVIAAAQALKLAGSAAVGVLVHLLQGLPQSETKARLVFWRWRHPEPSARAFTEHSHSDPRINQPVLIRAAGGSLPTEPKEQTLRWYRLYKQHASDAAVLTNHREYLLLRDLTWLAALYTVFGVALLALTQPDARLAVAYGIAGLVLSVALSLAAQRRGIRFVQTVLAVTSARDE